MIIHHDQDSVYTGHRWTGQLVLEDQVRLSYTLNGAKDNPEIEQYNRIPDIVSAILCDVELREEVRRNNARCFDQYTSPIAVAEYIVRALTGLGNA